MPNVNNEKTNDSHYDKDTDDLLGLFTQQPAKLASICDSTSVSDVIVYSENHQIIDDLELIAKADAVIQRGAPDLNNREQFIAQCNNLIFRYGRELQKSEFGFGASFVKHSIRLGNVLNLLKLVVKSEGYNWTDWSSKNLPIKKTSRENYMLIAKRNDAHPYFFLGQDRLIKLIRAAKKKNTEDAVGNFLLKHKIDFELESPVKFDEFSLQVDTAINVELLEKENLCHHSDIDYQLVRTVTEQKVKFNEKLLKYLTELTTQDMPLIQVLSAIAANKGKIPTKSKTRNPKYDDINILSSKLLEVAEFTLSDSVMIEQLDIELLNKVSEAIEQLKHKVVKSAKCD